MENSQIWALVMSSISLIISIIFPIKTIFQNNYSQKRNAMTKLSFYWEKYFEEIAEIRYLHKIKNYSKEEKELRETMVAHKYFEVVISYVTTDPVIKPKYLNTKNKIGKIKKGKTKSGIHILQGIGTKINLFLKFIKKWKSSKVNNPQKSAICTKCKKQINLENLMNDVYKYLMHITNKEAEPSRIFLAKIKIGKFGKWSLPKMRLQIQICPDCWQLLTK